MKLNKFPNLLYINSTVSDGNMSFYYGKKLEVLKNRQEYLEKFGISINSTISPTQIHSTIILKVDKSDPGKDFTADGFITNEVGIYLMIKVADCLALSFYDPKHGAIGITHGGWQGLDKGILKKIVQLMKQKFNTNPKDLIVEFSPSIGPCHYGGPPELRNTVKLKWKKYIANDADKNHGVNLWQFAEDQLIELGVLKEAIYNPKICTYESKEYFSHRRSEITKEPDYRSVTILGIKS